MAICIINRQLECSFKVLMLNISYNKRKFVLLFASGWTILKFRCSVCRIINGSLFLCKNFSVGQGTFDLTKNKPQLEQSAMAKQMANHFILANGKRFYSAREDVSLGYSYNLFELTLCWPNQTSFNLLCTMLK